MACWIFMLFAYPKPLSVMGAPNFNRYTIKISWEYELVTIVTPMSFNCSKRGTAK